MSEEDRANGLDVMGRFWATYTSRSDTADEDAATAATCVSAEEKKRVTIRQKNITNMSMDNG